MTGRQVATLGGIEGLQDKIELVFGISVELRALECEEGDLDCLFLQQNTAIFHPGDSCHEI